MGVLRFIFVGIGPAGGIEIVVAIAVSDQFTAGGIGFFGDSYRIGSHVGDQTRRFASDIDTLIQLLSDGYGAAGLEIEDIGRFLLQGAGDEGRWWFQKAVSPFDIA